VNRRRRDGGLPRQGVDQAPAALLEVAVDERDDGHVGRRQVPEVGVEAVDVAAVAPGVVAGHPKVHEPEPVLGRVAERLHPVRHPAAGRRPQEGVADPSEVARARHQVPRRPRAAGDLPARDERVVEARPPLQVADGDVTGRALLRLEDERLRQLLGEAPVCRPLDHQSEQQVVGVGVVPALARLGQRRRDVAQELSRRPLVLRTATPLRGDEAPLAHVVVEPRGVVEQLTQRDRAGAREALHPAAERVVQVEDAAGGELHDQAGDERLGDARDGEARVPAHRHPPARVRQSARAHPDHVPTDHHRGGGAGDVLRGSLTVERPLQARGERRLGMLSTAAHHGEDQQAHRDSPHDVTLTTSGAADRPRPTICGSGTSSRSGLRPAKIRTPDPVAQGGHDADHPQQRRDPERPG
jgi:hypothetical protein